MTIEDSKPSPTSSAGAADLGSVLTDGRFVRVWLSGGIAGTLRWLETLAFGVFVFQATGSPSLVALMTFVRMAPMLVLGLVAGAIADRCDRKRLLVGGLLVLAGTSAVLAALALSGRLAIWHLALGAFLGGTFWTGEFPVRRTMVGEIAGPARLAGAMALESTTSNATRMVGPLVGGILLDVVGLGGAFVLGAVLYTLAALLIAPVPYRAEAGAGGSRVLRSVLDGLAYTFQHRLVLAIMVMTVIFNFWGFAYLALIPVIGKHTLELSASLIGVLMSAEGLGSLVGALIVGALATPRQYLRVYTGGTALFLVMILIFGLSRSFALSLTVLFISGLGLAGFAVMQSTLVFLAAPEAMRSRLMGVLSVAIGSGPLGMLHVGWLAEALSAPAAILIIAGEGLAALALALWWWPELRQAHARRDLLERALLDARDAG